MPHMAIEPMSVGNLRPYARNARTHSKKQIKQIARSIERFGFTNRVLISDENEIMAGHGRVEAAKLLGIENVPTLRLSHLTEAQRRAYVIADNKLAQNAGWDRDVLAIELQALIESSISSSPASPSPKSTFSWTTPKRAPQAPRRRARTRSLPCPTRTPP